MSNTRTKILTKALEEIAGRIGGNEQINDRDAAQFYRGYNAAINSAKAVAWKAFADSSYAEEGEEIERLSGALGIPAEFARRTFKPWGAA